jgi:hypothetical protein
MGNKVSIFYKDVSGEIQELSLEDVYVEKCNDAFIVNLVLLGTSDNIFDVRITKVML